jgi:hypothetical protein
LPDFSNAEILLFALRRLKNSFFWLAVVPIFTSGQERQLRRSCGFDDISNKVQWPNGGLIAVMHNMAPSFNDVVPCGP